MKLKYLLIIFVVVFLSKVYSFPEITKIDEIDKLYQDKKYQEANLKYLNHYIDNSNDFGKIYNMANSFFKIGKWKKADYFYGLSAKASNKELKRKSFFNLGNTSVKLEELEKAVSYYKKALAIDPDHNKSKENLKFVLDLLKKKNNKKNQDNKSSKNDKNKQKQKNNEQKNNEQKNSPDKNKAEDPKKSNKDSLKDNKNPQKGNKSSKHKQSNKYSSKEMSKIESKRWLDQLEDSRKNYFKRRFYNVDNNQSSKKW